MSTRKTSSKVTPVSSAGSSSFSSSLTPIAAAIAIMSCGFASSVLAQEAAQQAAQEGLQSVVISANKRIEKLDKVPSSISVLTEESLERNKVVDFNGIVNLTPSLTVTTSSSTVGNNSINMRGIGTSSFTIGMSPDVAVIVDDIPVGMQMQAFQDLADVARVEVLKGPQSTLFGRASIAGAVNIVSKPITGPLAGSVGMELTSDGERRNKASYGGRLSDEFGFRIALSNNNFPGNEHNLELGTRTNGASSKTAVFKFQWKPNDKLDFDLSPRYNKTISLCCATPLTYVDSSAAYYGAIPVSEMPKAPISSVLAGITPSPSNTDVRHDRATSQILESRGVSFKANYYLDNGLTLTAITGYEKTFSQDQNDGDFSNVPVNALYNDFRGLPAPGPDVTGGIRTFDTKTVTQELRLISPDTGDFRYVAGLWYAKNDVYRFFTRGVLNVPDSSPKEYRTTIFNKNIAVFGQTNWDFAPSYTLTVGGRLNRETSGFTYRSGNPAPYPTSAGFVPTFSITGVDGRFHTPDATDDVFTGKLGLQKQFTKELMAYVSGSTGYKGYAYDLLSSTDAKRGAVQPVDPEKATSFEIGAKGNFLNNTLTVNVSAYRTKIKNFQSTSNTPVLDPVSNAILFLPFLNSVGAVQTQGLEMDVAHMPTKNLLVNAAFAYTDATITDYQYGDCYAVPGSANKGFNDNCIVGNPARGGANTSDKSGNTLPQAPKLKFNIGGQYDVMLDAPFNGFITAATRYQSETHLNLMNPTIKVPAHAISNVGFGIKDKKNKYTLTFDIRNVFNRQYSYYTGPSDLTVFADKNGNRVTSSNWLPPRDAFRYFSLRGDLRF